MRRSKTKGLNSFFLWIWKKRRSVETALIGMHEEETSERSLPGDFIHKQVLIILIIKIN